MKKYIFFILLFILFAGLLFIIFMLFLNGEKMLSSVFNLEQQDELLNSSQKKEQTLWQDKFLKLPKQDYIPAVEQFSMVFTPDTSALQPKTKFYELVIDKNDVYSLFCLKQTLIFFEVKYSLTHTEKSTEIFLDTDNQNLLKDIQTRLKIFDINADIKEIWL